MNWKLKAMIQNVIAKLPSKQSYSLYYFIQRRFGALRNLNPTSRLLAGVAIVEKIREQGQTIGSKTFLEVGTGRGISLPIALWLCGASKTITVDLNPYLKSELVCEDISYIRSHQQDIQAIFKPYACKPLFQERFGQLITMKTSLEHLLEMMNVQYLAPADAICLDLPSQSIDYHISHTVLEHIPPTTLKEMLLEGKRLLKENGLFVHFISLSDHFAHSDSSISAINFLQFSEDEWEHYAGNRYMYHNRLRVDDYGNLFKRVGLNISSISNKVDPRALKELREGFVVAERFRNKSAETNATVSVRIVASTN